MKSIIEIGVIVFALITIVLLACRIILSWKFGKYVSKLFSNAENISGKVFTYDQLSTLSAPVRRYFKHVLNDGQPYVSYVRLTHDGQFKTDLKKDWTAIKGEEYFTTAQPGFIWKGKTSLFTAFDMYIGKKGKLMVFLFSLFKIVNSHGDKLNQGELLRWLGECVWFPTSLLPGDFLEWQSIDDTSAKLIYKYDNMSLVYTVRFNDKDEIEQMETERYMGEGGLQKWIVKCANYQKRNGILIPITAEVLWELKEEDFSYAKFNVKTLEYNRPEEYA